jgi:hypothetical protein
LFVRHVMKTEPRTTVFGTRRELDTIRGQIGLCDDGAVDDEVKQLSLAGFEFAESAQSSEEFVELTDPIHGPFGRMYIV